MLKKYASLGSEEKNLIKNIILAFVIKGAALIVSLLSTPLYIKYFDDNTLLGVWYTILSVLSWISVCDLGLGNGLRNRLTTALAENNFEKSKKLTSSAYVAISAIIIPIAILGIIVIQFLDLNSFLNISESVISKNALRLSVSILLLGICLNFIIKTITVILYALQKPSINNFITLIGSIIPLIYISFFKSNSPETNLIALSIVHILAICLPLLIATIVVFSTQLKHSIPSIKHFEKSSAKDVMELGLKFFCAQLFFMLLMTTNEFFINMFFSPDYVVEYNIYYKIFTTVGSLFTLALTPLWSKVTRDIANKRYETVKKTNHFLYIISSLAFLAEFAIIPLLQWFLNIWLKENTISVNYITAVIFAFFGGVYIFNIALTTVANGIGELKTQIIFYGLGSFLKIPTILLLKEFFDTWNIIVIYNAVLLFLFCIFQFIWLEKKINTLSKN